MAKNRPTDLRLNLLCQHLDSCSFTDSDFAPEKEGDSTSIPWDPPLLIQRSSWLIEDPRPFRPDWCVPPTKRQREPRKVFAFIWFSHSTACLVWRYSEQSSGTPWYASLFQYCHVNTTLPMLSPSGSKSPPRASSIRISSSLANSCRGGIRRPI